MPAASSLRKKYAPPPEEQPSYYDPKPIPAIPTPKPAPSPDPIPSKPQSKPKKSKASKILAGIKKYGPTAGKAALAVASIAASAYLAKKGYDASQQPGGVDPNFMGPEVEYLPDPPGPRPPAVTQNMSDFLQNNQRQPVANMQESHARVPTMEGLYHNATNKVPQDGMFGGFGANAHKPPKIIPPVKPVNFKPHQFGNPHVRPGVQPGSYALGRLEGKFGLPKPQSQYR